MNPYFGKDNLTSVSSDQYDAVKILLASPDTIRSWSHGEVKNPETINYRTYRPERDGLFCEKIFGPTHDWECACGKYKRIKHKGVICDRCGVEVTVARVRRERMGHIELAVPVSHIWFFKCTPSRIGLMLDMPANQLERVLYYEDRLVTNPGDTPLSYLQLLSEMEYQEAYAKYGDSFETMMGAEAVKKCLSNIKLDDLMVELEQQIENTRSKQTRKRITKRMKVCEGFRNSGARPEWMILDVLPVIPPDLRPLVPLEGGRFATSDLNDLYRRVINRNNRLKNLLQLKTPEVIIRNEKRMLQEAVDAVFDNGRHGRPVTGSGNRPLKSLSDMLKGKTGRFRQNLLGKRVDYSGRSVIVVGPRLKLYQCGLPKKMALVLFEPFIIRRLKELGESHTVKSARKMIERQDDRVWEALDDVIKGKTVMLNRAPTLHRLSMQSFEPVLIEGEAIQLHPMVCTPFNADFDGDQMAVHVPLSIEAQLESRLLMLASNSIFSPASGKSIMTPTQDIALGIYYLTEVGQRDKLAGHNPGKDPIHPEEHLPFFATVAGVLLARQQGALDNHSRIIFKNPDYGRDTPRGIKERKIIETTVGRVIFNEVWPEELGFINEKINKSALGDLILECHKVAGHDRTVKVLDKLKALGFSYACLAGVSMGLKDMIRPAAKDQLINAAREEVGKVDRQLQMGVITDGERHNKIVDIWQSTTDKVADALYEAIDKNQMPGNENPRETNPVFMMVDSKARGSKQQIRQLAGMRGLMANPKGDIIETPILASFREGLSVLEYFISSHGARKGLADTALKTADAGYLTRKLVDVAQDVIIVCEDCNTVNGIEIVSDNESESATPLRQRILGRTALRDITDPKDPDTILVEANAEIDEAACDRIEAAEIDRVWIRSGLTCDAPHGMCAKCYGRDLSTGKQVEIGTAVGIVAAQSIGEPGTQLTMRTFHVGGTASAKVVTPEIIVHNAGRVFFESNLRCLHTDDGKDVVLNKYGTLVVRTQEKATRDDAEECREREPGDLFKTDTLGRRVDSEDPTIRWKEEEKIVLQIGTTLRVKEGDYVKPEQIVAMWDPHSVPILSEFAGTVRLDDCIEGVTVETETDAASGTHQLVAIDPREDLHPSITIMGPDPDDPESGNGKKAKIVVLGSYPVPVGAHILVKDGDKVIPAFILAKTPRQAVKSADITGGLPRVAELFEARRPKDAADIAKIEGIVDFGQNVRGRRCVIVTDEYTGESEEHLIQMGKHVIVTKGDRVRKGQQLTDGPRVPQEILEICGQQDLQRYLVEEVQRVYRVQGVEINDKHIEIIVRQMLRKVRITNPGDTDFLWGEQVTRQFFLSENEKVTAEGKRPAEAQPALLGITKASLETDSFISAASFQDTTRVLTDAATLGRVDELRGFKENVILGHLIPGGTGFPMHRHIKLIPLAEPISEEEYHPHDQDSLAGDHGLNFADEGFGAFSMPANHEASSGDSASESSKESKPVADDSNPFK